MTTAAMRQAIIDEALTWKDTPYHYHACIRGVGVDCGMLLVGIARNLGLVAPDWMPPFYSQQFHLHQRDEMYCHLLDAQGATQIPLEQQKPGHIVLFRWETWQPASHAAILMPYDHIIHARTAANPRHAVVRHEPMPPFFAAHVAYAYAWPEVPQAHA